MTFDARVLDNRAMRTMNPLPRVLLAWLMLAALLLGALNWARSASPANFFPATEFSTAHAHNSLWRQGNLGFDYRGASDAPVGAKGGTAAGDTVTVYRVQGGEMPGASKTLITLDANGNPIIQNGTLNVSIGDAAHAEYFQTLRPGSTVTSFEIPTWMDNFIRENAISQDFYRTNPLNQGGLAPKIVDPTMPGRAYELPSPWGKWLQENAIPGSGKVQ